MNKHFYPSIYESLGHLRARFWQPYSHRTVPYSIEVNVIICGIRCYYKKLAIKNWSWLNIFMKNF